MGKLKTKVLEAEEQLDANQEAAEYEAQVMEFLRKSMGV